MLPKHNMNIGQHLVWHLTYECRQAISSIGNLDHKSPRWDFYETYIMVEYEVFHHSTCWILNGRWRTLETGNDYLPLISGLNFLFVSLYDSSSR